MKAYTRLIVGLTLVLALGLGGVSTVNAAAVDPLQALCTGKTTDPNQPDITITGGNAGNTHVCQDQEANKGVTNPVIAALKLTINILSIIIGVTAVIIIILGGFNIINSGGDAQGVAKARQSILYAVIGIVIAMFAA